MKYQYKLSDIIFPLTSINLAMVHQYSLIEQSLRVYWSMQLNYVAKNIPYESNVIAQYLPLSQNTSTKVLDYSSIVTHQFLPIYKSGTFDTLMVLHGQTLSCLARMLPISLSIHIRTIMLHYALVLEPLCTHTTATSSSDVSLSA